MERDGGFLIGEGSVVVRRIVAAGIVTRSVLCTKSQFDRNADVLAALPTPIYIVAPVVLREIVEFDLHRGIVCGVDRPPALHASALISDPSVRIIVALERINDFENLGSILRSATALGADAPPVVPTARSPRRFRGTRHVPTAPWSPQHALPSVSEGPERLNP